MTRDDAQEHAAVSETAKQFGAHARQYAVSERHLRGRTRLLLLERMQPVADETLVDVGSGPGPVALAFAPYVDRAIGLDVAPEMLRAAALAAQRAEITNAAWVCGDVHRLPFADRSVALVTSRACPHHFHSIERAVTEMARVLARGGRLGIADGTVPDDPAVDAFVNALDVLHDPTTVRNYSAREWRSFYEAAGLRVDSVEENMLENDEGMSLVDWLGRSGASNAVFEESRRMLLGASPKIRGFLRVRQGGPDVRFDLPRCVIVGTRVD